MVLLDANFALLLQTNPAAHWNLSEQAVVDLPESDGCIFQKGGDATWHPFHGSGEGLELGEMSVLLRRSKGRSRRLGNSFSSSCLQGLYFF